MQAVNNERNIANDQPGGGAEVIFPEGTPANTLDAPVSSRSLAHRDMGIGRFSSFSSRSGYWQIPGKESTTLHVGPEGMMSARPVATIPNIATAKLSTLRGDEREHPSSRAAEYEAYSLFFSA